MFCGRDRAEEDGERSRDTARMTFLSAGAPLPRLRWRDRCTDRRCDHRGGSGGPTKVGKALFDIPDLPLHACEILVHVPCRDTTVCKKPFYDPLRLSWRDIHSYVLRF